MANTFDVFDNPVVSGAKDVGTALTMGTNDVLGIAGNVARLITGEDNVLTRKARENAEFLQQQKSPELQAAEQERDQAVAAEPNLLYAIGTYVQKTASNPRLWTTTVAQTAPSMVGPGVVGAGTKMAAGKLLAKKGAEFATKAGMATAIGTGVGMQAADVGGQQMDEMLRVLNAMPEDQAMQIPQIADLVKNKGVSLPAAKTAVASYIGMETALGAGTVSALTQLIPGAQTIEKAIVGGTERAVGRSALSKLAAAGKGAIKGAAGETAQEVPEEGGGQFISNLLARQVEPGRELTAGVAPAVGQAIVGAGTLGAVAGSTGRAEPAKPLSRPVQEGEPAAGIPVEPPAPVATREALTETPQIDLTKVENMSEDQFWSAVDARQTMQTGTELPGFQQEQLGKAKFGEKAIDPEAAKAATDGVNATIEEWRKENPNSEGVEVATVFDPNMLHNGYGIRGAYNRGSKAVLLNAAFLQDPETVKQVLNHEWAHHTLDTEEGRAALQDFARRSLPEGELEKLSERYGTDDPLVLVDEWIAQNQEKAPGVLARMVNFVREWLAKIGIVNLSHDEVARILLRTLRQEASGRVDPVTEREPAPTPETEQRMSLAEEPESYRGQHMAPGREAAPAHDLTSNKVYPEDVYSRPDWYETDEGLAQLRRVAALKGKPDEKVFIYRAIPTAVYDKAMAISEKTGTPFLDQVIRPGDWVTISKQYASDHGESALGGDFKVVAKQVPASDIFTNGDSIMEWGYQPKTEERFSLAQTETPEFKEWNKGNKVVDDQGKPLPVYHGTNQTFTIFGDNSQRFDVGWFTDSPEEASMYAKVRAKIRGEGPGVGEQVYKSYVSMKNPMVVDAKGQSFNAIRRPGKLLKSNTTDLAAEAYKMGHDGLIVENVYDSDRDMILEEGEKPITVYVVFNPKQVKSATGNVGAFGQRPVTAEEAGRLGMTEAEATEAQERGDMRFSLAQTETPEFQKWFGDSKVIDENNKPLKVFHGTPKPGFNEFRVDSGFGYGPGAYFTPDPELASKYGLAKYEAAKYSGKRTDTDEAFSGGVYPAYLALKNPISGADFRKLPGQKPAEKNAEARRLGYDGIINYASFSGDRGDISEVVAFYPEQVKSATGNVGAFGQRPVTAEEASRLGMTEAEAAEAQKRGDMRFALTQDQIDAVDGKRVDELDIPELVKTGVLTDRYSSLLQSLRETAGEGNTVIEVVSPEDFPRKAAGLYNPNTDVIQVSSDTNVDLGRILLHEYTHALTVIGLKYADEITTSRGDILSAEPRPGVSGRELRAASRKMDDLFDTAQKAASEAGEKFYGLTNREEFVAEAFSNKRFQQFLSSIPATGAGSKQSLFDKFVSIVKQILGVGDEDESLLTEVISATQPLVRAQKKISSTLMAEDALPEEERVSEEGDEDYEGDVDTTSRLGTAAAREREELPPTSALNTLYAKKSAVPLPLEGKRTNGQVAEQFRQSAREYWGRELNSSNITPQELDRLVDNATEETVAGLKASNHAGNWYTTAIRKAMAIARVLHPELSDDALARKAGFKDAHAAEVGLATAMAITSQNLNVEKNTQYANEQFRILKETGRFDPSKKYGSKKLAISGNLELANTLLDRVGWEGMEEFLNREYTVKELNEAASEVLGREVNIAGKVDDIVNGSAIFGPKIGAGFFQNLRGNFDPVTVDLWMRRTWGRWTGDVLPEPLDANRLARMLAGMREAGIQLPEELRSVRTVLAKKGRKVPTLTEETANRILSNPEAVTAAYDFAGLHDSRWNKIYSEVRQNITPEQAAAVRDGSLSLEQLNRQQQKSLREKRDAWQELEDRPSISTKEGKEAQKEFFAKMDEAAGRTATLTNEELSEFKPEWAKAARVIRTLLKPIDAPSDIDRRVIVDLVNRVRHELDRRGIKATNADIQAILWYPEKDIWAKLAGKPESKLKSSYDEEFLRVAESQGLGEQARAAAAGVRD